MAVINGNDIGVYYENQLIGCLTSSTFSSTNSEIDVTCKDDGGARKVLPGGNQASVSFEGLFNSTSTYGLQELMAVHLNKTRVWIKMGDEATLTVSAAYAYLNTLEWTGPLNAGTTFSGTFTIDGTWTFTTT